MKVRGDLYAVPDREPHRVLLPLREPLVFERSGQRAGESLWPGRNSARSPPKKYLGRNRGQDLNAYFSTGVPTSCGPTGLKLCAFLWIAQISPVPQTECDVGGAVGDLGNLFRRTVFCGIQNAEQITSMKQPTKTPVKQQEPRRV